MSSLFAKIADYAGFSFYTVNQHNPSFSIWLINAKYWFHQKISSKFIYRYLICQRNSKSPPKSDPVVWKEFFKVSDLLHEKSYQWYLSKDLVSFLGSEVLAISCDTWFSGRLFFKMVRKSSIFHISYNRKKCMEKNCKYAEYKI